MDGVLTDILSSWKHIHDYFGTTNEQSVSEYLEGKIDDLEFIRRDVSLWKENGELVTVDKLREILFDIPLMKGAPQTIETLRSNNVKTGIVSAGLDILGERVKRELGIDYVFANGVKTDRYGRLTGEGILGVMLVHKDETVRRLATQARVPLERCAAVGNSCFDIPMFETCSLGVAFNPEDECVRQAADVVIEGNDLRNVLPALEQYFT
jgi:phosphoserine phosphatase